MSGAVWGRHVTADTLHVAFSLSGEQPWAGDIGRAAGDPYPVVTAESSRLELLDEIHTQLPTVLSSCHYTMSNQRHFPTPSNCCLF